MADIDFPKSKIWWIFGTRCQVGGQWLCFVYPKTIVSELEVKDESGLHRVYICINSVQFRSVTQSCLTLCDPMNCSTPGLPVHHQLPEFTQTHVHQVGDAIQPSHPLLSPSPPAPNSCQHQGLFQWVNSSHEVAKVLEHWSFLPMNT